MQVEHSVAPDVPGSAVGRAAAASAPNARGACCDHGIDGDRAAGDDDQLPGAEIGAEGKGGARNQEDLGEHGDDEPVAHAFAIDAAAR